MAKYCILGSGITGLSVAYYLRKDNPNAEIVILEEQGKSGGVIESNAFGDLEESVLKEMDRLF